MLNRWSILMDVVYLVAWSNFSKHTHTHAHLKQFKSGQAQMSIDDKKCLFAAGKNYVKIEQTLAKHRYSILDIEMTSIFSW